MSSLKKSKSANYKDFDYELQDQTIDRLKDDLKEKQLEVFSLKSANYLLKLENGVKEHERDIWFQKFNESDSNLCTLEAQFNEIKFSNSLKAIEEETNIVTSDSGYVNFDSDDESIVLTSSHSTILLVEDIHSVKEKVKNHVIEKDYSPLRRFSDFTMCFILSFLFFQIVFE